MKNWSLEQELLISGKSDIWNPKGVLIWRLPIPQTYGGSSLISILFRCSCVNFGIIFLTIKCRYSHLNAGRVASGALTLPRWTSQSSVESNAQHTKNPSMEPCLLTTCVGSIMELRNLIIRAQNKFGHLVLCHSALVALFYFMRCSQLEHNEGILFNFLSIYQIKENRRLVLCLQAR